MLCYCIGMTLEDIRQSEIDRTKALAAEGKCAETPDHLVGPGCEFDKGHEGRCSWGAFFEPDGSFHATDPNGEYPQYPSSAFMPPGSDEWIS